MNPELKTKITPINPAAAQDLDIRLSKQDDYRKCFLGHKCIEVDERERTVTCLTCGCGVDPFDYILEWALKGDERNSALENIEIRRKIAAAEVEDLARQIRNMRAALKRGGMEQSAQDRTKYDRWRLNPHLVEKEFIPAAVPEI